MRYSFESTPQLPQGKGGVFSRDFTKMVFDVFLDGRGVGNVSEKYTTSFHTTPATHPLDWERNLGPQRVVFSENGV